MVAGVARITGVAHDALAVDDERPRHLHHVPDGALDVVALARRLQSAGERRRADHLPPRAAFQSEGLIALALRVGQTGEGGREAVAERLRLLRVALRDGDDTPARRLDLRCALTERRQVLPAERSAKVPEERDDDRALPPELRERNVSSVATAEGDVGRGLPDLDHRRQYSAPDKPPPPVRGTVTGSELVGISPAG